MDKKFRAPLHAFLMLLLLTLLTGASAQAARILYSNGHTLDTSLLAANGGNTLVATFDSDDARWATALSGGYGDFDAILVGESNNFDNLSAATLSSIAAYVSNGGRVFVVGAHGGPEAGFLNAVFGYSTANIGYGYVSDEHIMGNLQPEAAGTTFAGGPADVRGLSGTVGLSGAPGVIIYSTAADGTAVFVNPVGLGMSGYLGWDFCCGTPAYQSDWFNVLDRALKYALPTLSIGDVTVTEGDARTSSATFQVSLSAPSALPVTFSYATSGGTAGGAAAPETNAPSVATAPGSEDFQNASGTITIPAGGTSAFVTIAIIGDTIPEPTESFNVTLSVPSHAYLSDATGVGTILDNDAQPSLSVGNGSVVEGNSGATATSVTVSLSGPSSQTITVDYSTSDGSAQAGSDYDATSGSLSFAPGQTSAQVPLSIISDQVVEGDETFYVNLSNPTNASILNSEGLVSITNDDGAAIVVTAANDLRTSESGATATFTVVLTSQPTASVTVGISSNKTSEGTVSPASLLFDGSNWSVPQTVTITGVDDTLVDGDVDYSVITAPASSLDSSYDGYDAADVAVKNLDNEFAPTITSLDPTSGSPDGGVAVTVTGTNFRSGATSRFGLVDAATTVTDGEHLNVITPALTAGTLYSYYVSNTDETSGFKNRAFFADFNDAPASNPFHQFIVAIATNGITLGCGAGNYCPSDTVKRVEMALFISRAIAGSDAAVPSNGTVNGQSYICSTGGVSLFSDVSATDPFCRHIHYVASRGVTSGCASGRFCPSDVTPREQIAAFIARAIAEGDYLVPAAYSDATTGRSYDLNSGNTHFVDMNGSSFTRHAHFLWARGVIDGCDADHFCPADLATRDQMAKFLANGFRVHFP